MYIPDPLEILDAQIERMCDEFDGVHCMSCGKVTEDFFPLTSHPASPAVCEECATAHMKEQKNESVSHKCLCHPGRFNPLS